MDGLLATFWISLLAQPVPFKDELVPRYLTNFCKQSYQANVQ